MAKVKILFLASNPLSQTRLALDEEIRAITTQVRSADHRDALELISAWAVRADELQQLLLRHKPHIVHFSGHATRDTPTELIPPGTTERDLFLRGLTGDTPTGGIPLSTLVRDMVLSGDIHLPRETQIDQLVLMTEGGQPHPMSKATLVHLFHVLKDNVHLVLLNACHSEPIAEALVEVIPCAIGMSGEITDDAAIAFAAAFYRGLGFGRNIEEAFNLGKNALMNLQVPEDQAPRLYSRKGGVNAAKVVLVGHSITPSQWPTAASDRNRVAMLEKVRAIWITGFLDKSLFHETRILLGLNERPDAVARPMDLLARRPDEDERPLPSGTQIVDVFDTMDQAMLILGAPGSGKTTLLLELARDLLTRATHDPEHPIPVIFPLSAWNEMDLWFGSLKLFPNNFGGWLEKELCYRYDVPRDIACEWVETDQVLPLLDGLDEVGAELRAACVEAINDFRHLHGLRPLVITSRTADYQALAKPLRLHGAIFVRPLSHEQVNGYLTDLGPAGEPVRSALRDDSSLWELVDSPLLLNIITVAYSGRSEGSPPVDGTVAERRDYLFGMYVNQMLRRRAASDRYTPEQTVLWLSRLAFLMAGDGETVFYLKRLEEEWLYGGHNFDGTRGTKRTDIIFLVLLGAVLVALLVVMPVVVLVAVPVYLLVWFVLGGQGNRQTLGDIETTAIPNEGVRRSARNALLVALIFGLVAGAVFGLVFGLTAGVAAGVVAALIFGWQAGAHACFEHLFFRLWLRRNHSGPWNYVRFLDYAAERVLLRKVGDGYAFFHRMLLEYFAARYIGPSIDSPRRAMPSSIEADS